MGSIFGNKPAVQVLQNQPTFNQANNQVPIQQHPSSFMQQSPA